MSMQLANNLGLLVAKACLFPFRIGLLVVAVSMNLDIS